MYKNAYYFFIIFISLCFIACDKDNDGQDPNALTLEVSSDTIYLDPAKANEEALTFSWNEGIDRGAENSITYYFRMVRLGEDFNIDSIDPIEIASDESREVHFTHRELAELLTEKWDVLPGDEQALQARVVAKINGPVFIYPEISYVDVIIVNYQEDPNIKE